MRTQWISALCLVCLLSLCLGQSLVADDPTQDDIQAIEFLGAADAAGPLRSSAQKMVKSITINENQRKPMRSIKINGNQWK